MEELGKQTVAKFGKVDVMVYVTGTNTPNRYLDKLTPELWDQLISVNLNGVHRCSMTIEDHNQRIGLQRFDLSAGYLGFEHRWRH